VRLRVHAAIREIPRAAWDALVGEGSPFLEWTWLDCLEEAGCVAPETGWLPHHLTLWDGERLVGGCPLYVKAHSLGEFVFDQAWAAAAERAGLRYYPKLLVGVPFTPVAGARLLAAGGYEQTARSALARALEGFCVGRFSSAHVTFCAPEDAATLAACGWLERRGHQYHWQNAGFQSFEDYLQSLRSKRRNQVRRELRGVAAQGVEITVHVGRDIPEALLARMFDLYRATVDALPWGHRHLNARFFALLAARFRERLCVVAARERGDLVAGTINVQKGRVLYGRYWGALRPRRDLHFAVCYYAAVAHCIARGLVRFEPGAGGEFKHLRGFEACPTTSMHWIEDARLRAAVARSLERERAAEDRELANLRAHSALRRDRPGPAEP
jgi:predicted N-acyltransferase